MNKSQILRDYKRGVTVAEIAKKHQTSPSTVSRMATAAGMARRKVSCGARAAKTQQAFEAKPRAEKHERGLITAVQRGWDYFWSRPHRKHVKIWDDWEQM